MSAYMNANFFKKTIAAVDLGSQTFRMAVVRIVDNRPHVLASELNNVRLGQGLFAKGILNENAIKRGIGKLRDFRNVIDKFGVCDVLACGTAALRNAANAGEFLKLAEAEGFKINLLSGDEEALMSAMGVRTSLPDLTPPFLVVDVGGGSSEFVLTTNRKTSFNWSIDIGAVNLTEEFIKKDPPLPEELEKLGVHVRQKLSDLFAKLPEFPKTVVGVGGTATTLAAISLNMKRYDPRRIRGYAIGSRELDKLWGLLTGVKIHERRSINGLESRRADIILGGAAIFRDILHISKFKELTISDGGLLLGLLTCLIDKEPYNHAEPPNIGCLYL
nr:Ppx/GppA family phosphatase [Deltaproteobacteria bacterium]